MTPHPEKRRILQSLRSLQEQDEADLLRWWKDMPNGTKVIVWDAIHRIGGENDPIGIIISQFAQYGFTQICLLAGDTIP